MSPGIHTPIDIKVFGSDLTRMEALAEQIEATVRAVPGTSSAYAERLTGGYCLAIEPDLRRLDQHGLTVGEIQQVISAVLGVKWSQRPWKAANTLE